MTKGKKLYNSSLTRHHNSRWAIAASKSRADLFTGELVSQVTKNALGAEITQIANAPQLVRVLHYMKDIRVSHTIDRISVVEETGSPLTPTRTFI